MQGAVYLSGRCMNDPWGVEFKRENAPPGAPLSMLSNDTVIYFLRRMQDCILSNGIYKRPLLRRSAQFEWQPGREMSNRSCSTRMENQQPTTWELAREIQCVREALFQKLSDLHHQQIYGSAPETSTPDSRMASAARIPPATSHR